MRPSDLCRFTARPDSTSPGVIKHIHSPPLSFASYADRSRETCSKLSNFINAVERIVFEKLMMSAEIKLDLFHYCLNEALLILNGKVKSSISFNLTANDSFSDDVEYCV